jgi:hypothetical protein
LTVLAAISIHADVMSYVSINLDPFVTAPETIPSVISQLQNLAKPRNHILHFSSFTDDSVRNIDVCQHRPRHAQR